MQTIVAAAVDNRRVADLAEPVNRALRTTILTVAGNRGVSRAVSRYGMRLGAGRFVAGETLDDAVPVLRRLNERGLDATTTILGETIHDEAATRAVVSAYHEVLERVAAEGLRCHVALKLTHLGVELAEDLAFANVRELVEHAASLDSFIRIDMEDSAVTDATLRIYRRLREAGLDRVGTVLQSYLYRTEEDLNSLLPLQPNLRIVKGAYLEPPEIAYPQKNDVDRMYARLVELSMDGGGYTAVATHDERLLEHAIDYAEKRGLGRDRFELQMLYGIRPQLQAAYAQRGFTVRIATPFGRDWYPFFMRRLAERPANLLFLARNVVRS
jgi:proline dehydrogenase